VWRHADYSSAQPRGAELLMGREETREEEEDFCSKKC
jgi:hypothetical protein